MHVLEQPSPENNYQELQARLLASSYHRLTGRLLFGVEESPRALFEAPFGLVSHNTAPVPVFNYGNQTALAAFEMSWPEFIRLASRDSAETVNQQERELLMRKVREDGFVDNYRGIRISSSGRRFWIERATIWNVVDELGVYRGQAAIFYLE
jgi:MEKHLA domain-containing protein